VLIHVATDNDIYPPRFGATQRSFGLCRGLARRHGIHALCVVPNRDRAPAEQVANGVRLSRRRAWYTSVAWRLDRWGLAPMAVAARGHRAGAARLLDALPGEATVFAADLLLTPLFERHPAPLKVYAAHNVEQDHFRETHPRLGSSRRWAGEIAALESRAAGQAALVVACTAADARRFGELYGVPAARIHVAANGWDETRVHPVTPESRARERAARHFAEHETVALFVGSDVPHNRAALRMLVHDVLPRLAADHFRLAVVGSVSRAVGDPRPAWLSVAGEVEDVEPWLHAADVGLNPVTGGGGSNVKLPTYLAAGLAVITTPFGLRGYPELARHVTVAEPGETAAALRQRPRGWPAGGGGLPEAVAALSWGRIGEQLAGRLEDLANRERPPAVAGGAA
jgi:hypothetical protein